MSRKKGRERSWVDIVSMIEPLVFQVRAGDGLGTAFVIGVTSNDGGLNSLLVTAWHVVKDVVASDEVLDLVCPDGKLLSKRCTAPSKIYRIGPPECDTAVLHVCTREPLASSAALRALPLKTMLPRGAEIGWLGYPGLAFPELCFFRGVVSGYREKPPIYLVDGVGINGVSGGPAFDRTGLLVGFVSAYVPNDRGEGVTLPGLMIATPINLVRFWLQEILGVQVRQHPDHF